MIAGRLLLVCQRGILFISGYPLIFYFSLSSHILFVSLHECCLSRKAGQINKTCLVESHVQLWVSSALSTAKARGALVLQTHLLCKVVLRLFQPFSAVCPQTSVTQGINNNKKVLFMPALPYWFLSKAFPLSNLLLSAISGWLLRPCPQASAKGAAITPVLSEYKKAEANREVEMRQHSSQSSFSAAFKKSLVDAAITLLEQEFETLEQKKDHPFHLPPPPVLWVKNAKVTC